MQQIKIIFFDIDGTLIDMQSKHISPRTVEALHRLRSNGIRLCIATGRAPVTLPDFGGAEFDAYLTFNGSLCYAGLIRSTAARSTAQICSVLSKMRHHWAVRWRRPPGTA